MTTTNDYSPGLEGVISNATTISYLDLDKEEIVIRGYDLIELAQKLSYLETAYLVMHGKEPTQQEAVALRKTLSDQATLPPEVYAMLKSLPKQTHPMDALRTGISMLAGYEDPAILNDHHPEPNFAKGLKIMAKAPVIACNAYRANQGQPSIPADPKLGFTENILWMINGKRPDKESVDMLDMVLTCYIEHELANSTFTARIIASSLCDIYGAITGAVASLKGPLHGGANEAAAQMLVDILQKGGAAKAEQYITDIRAAHGRIMGFGHRVYMRKYDPRAFLLKDYLPRLLHKKPEGEELYAIYRKVEEVMFRETKLYPNADYPIGFILYLLDVPIPLFTPLFLCARIPGLIAHVEEQHKENRLFRPRVIYLGPRELHPEKAGAGR